MSRFHRPLFQRGPAPWPRRCSGKLSGASKSVGVIFSFGFGAFEVTQFERYFSTDGGDQRRDLFDARRSHAHRRASNAQASIYRSGVVKNGGSDAANVRLVLFQVAGVPVFANAIPPRLQLLKIADGN